MAKRLKKDGTEYADKVARIPLTYNRYLCKDAFQMWIAKEKSIKGETQYERITGYYTTYESLLDGFIREQGKKTKGKDVEEALAEFAKVEKDMRKIARMIGKELDNASRERVEKNSD